jgi:tetratricopeptide (TPR) repeat protein
MKIGETLRRRWEIRAELMGGMGIVYVVYDREWQTLLAAKTFRDDVFAESPTVAILFEEEAYAWINLDTHDNIVQAFMLERIQGKPVVFVEYVKGKDLGWSIANGQRDDASILKLALQICDGMSHAYSRGLFVHRDIKPQNCLLTKDGTVKVTDFGLAKAFNGLARNTFPGIPARPGTASSPSFSAIYGVAGTCTHMAPEQFETGDVDRRADIYSFGVVLFQLCTGRLPFQATAMYGQESWEEFRELHQTASIPPLGGNHHPGMVSLVAKCLAKSATDRFPDFDAVWDELSAILKRTPQESAPQRLASGFVSWITWNSKGANLAKLGRLDEAVTAFDRALELNPDQPLVLSNKAGALAELGRADAALECCDRAIVTHPELANGWINRCSIMIVRKDAGAALQSAEKATELAPAMPEAWVAKGNAYQEINRHADALACFDKALELDSRDDRALVQKASSLRSLGSDSEALACYDEAMKVNPRAFQARLDMAEIFIDLDRVDEALACLDQNIDLMAENAAAWSNKGAFLARLDRVTEAIECFDRAIEADPKLAEAWINKAAALENLGRLQDAVYCLERSVTLHPGNGQFQYRLGRALAAIGRLHEANQVLLAAESLGVEQATSAMRQIRESTSSLPADRASKGNETETAVARLVNEGVAHRRAGKLENAIVCYNKALEIDPDNALAYANRGNCYQSLRKLDAALADEDKSIELGLDEGLAYFNRAVTKTMLGREDDALRDYDAALNRSPDLQPALANRAHLLRSRRQHRTGLADADRAIKLNPSDVVARLARALILGDICCFQKAKDEYASILDLAPDHPDAHFGLAAAFAALGDFSRARRSYEQAYNLGHPVGRKHAMKAKQPDDDSTRQANIRVAYLAFEALLFSNDDRALHKAIETFPFLISDSFEVFVRTTILPVLPADFQEVYETRCKWLRNS